ncbi:hypothetical protein [Microbacterium album]|uniref:DUF3618 domain-containing protein n=1 Tax=Microbacterium album TaxID=2053191 RepID=A0A917IJ85_9MICO|nr:hypothetical protein [Microbacterium album]GGH50225.1 hypothetical protein GCM10010921_28810 [Microbacterium album]
MSSELTPRTPAHDQSRTIVPSGITDPVERARAELAATLAAIEQKANLPRRAAEAAELGAVRARAFARRSPVAAAGAAVAAALAVGAAMWGLARLISR